MIRRSNQCLLAIVALGSLVVLASTPGSAFTFEDGKGNALPKFDLEEQSKQFSTPQLDTSTAAKQYETPFGKLQLGIDPKDTIYGYRSPFAPTFGPSGNSDRRHYERMFTPEYLSGGGRGPN